MAAENSDIVLAALVALIAAAGSVISAWFGFHSRQDAREARRSLATPEGGTLGELLTRVEERASSLLRRVDRMEVKLDEHRSDLEEHLAVTQDRFEAVRTILEDRTKLFEELAQKLDSHEAETRPLRDWVVEQIERREGEDP